MSGESAAETIDALLPQTQCGECGYRGCRPYADALASGKAATNLCAPGGGELAAELAAFLGRPIPPDAGIRPAPPAVAVIDENACIGCTLCLAACPVDAIVGARRRMHTVIAAECTGCALCLPPCPVDCIALPGTGLPYSRADQKAAAPRLRERYRAHLERQAQRGKARKTTADSAEKRKRDAITRAMARARARLAAHGAKD